MSTSAHVDLVSDETLTFPSIILSLAFQSILYGLFLTVVSLSIVFLDIRRLNSNATRFFIPAMNFLSFGTSTAYLGISFFIAFDILSPTTYSFDVPLDAAQMFLPMINYVLNVSILCWRLFSASSSSLKTRERFPIIPSVLISGSIVSVFVALGCTKDEERHKFYGTYDGICVQITKHALFSSWVLLLAASIAITCLFSLSLWRNSQQSTRRMSTDYMTKAQRISVDIFESGILTCILYIVLISTNIGYFFDDLLWNDTVIELEKVMTGVSDVHLNVSLSESVATYETGMILQDLSVHITGILTGIIVLLVTCRTAAMAVKKGAQEK